MRIPGIIILVILFFSVVQVIANVNGTNLFTDNLNFRENKGQVCDQYDKPRHDVLFSGNTGEFVFNLKMNGISYQLSRVDNSVHQTTANSPRFNRIRTPSNSTSIYRVDIDWLDCNINPNIVRNGMIEGYEHYYSESCPNGALEVRCFKEIVYENIYKGIDLHWYEKDGHLKYDYKVSVGGNYKIIRLQINGATSLRVSPEGELVIETPFGMLVEPSPIVFQEGRRLKARWVTKNSIASFEIDGVNENAQLIIDPLVRTWGTYYGGSRRDMSNACVTDSLGNIYIAGESESIALNSIATVGSYQTTFGGGSQWGDAFLAKFDALGQRLWATYYGGNGSDLANWCFLDSKSNVCIVGVTTSTNANVMTTLNAHQTVFGGGSSDAFVVKFDKNGLRVWGTYYGGFGEDAGYTGYADNLGNIYLTGISNSAANISTPGSFQASYGGGGFDGILVQFNSLGTRMWSTYYGGDNIDQVYQVYTDKDANVYICGVTNSKDAPLSTPSSFQENKSGPVHTYDGFLAKFSNNGNRMWSTFYGGTGNDYAYTLCIHDSDLYMAGTSTSNGTTIATNAAHQAINGGKLDGFLCKFSLDGVRKWSTFYGGPGNEDWAFVKTDSENNVYLAGSTSSKSGIATPCTYQETFGGGISDAFIVKFTKTGLRRWATYYGGGGFEQWPFIHFDLSNNLFLCGSTSTSADTIIATSTSHQFNYAGGSSDGFFTKFGPCVQTLPKNTTPQSNLAVYCGSSATLTTDMTCGAWSNSLNGNKLFFGQEYITPPIIADTVYYVSDVSCGEESQFSTPVQVKVIMPVTKTSSSGTICAGNQIVLIAEGGQSYQWLPKENISNSTQSIITEFPKSNMNYSVIIYFNDICYTTSTIHVEVLPLPEIYAGQDSEIEAGDMLELRAEGEGEFKWITTELMSCYDCKETIVYPFTNTCYTVELKDMYGCKNQDEVCVEIINDFAIYIPNCFTPNNDGKNDVFQVFGFRFRDYNLTIYDRWGVKLFSSGDVNDAWDGTYKGVPCKTDTYIYKLKFSPVDGRSEEKVGYIVLLND